MCNTTHNQVPERPLITQQCNLVNYFRWCYPQLKLNIVNSNNFGLLRYLVDVLYTCTTYRQRLCKTNNVVKITRQQFLTGSIRPLKLTQGAVASCVSCVTFLMCPESRKNTRDVLLMHSSLRSTCSVRPKHHQDKLHVLVLKY